MKQLRRQTELWVLRGTLRGEDVSIVIEAASSAEAECAGLKKGIDIVVVDLAAPHEVQAAREQQLLWRCTPEPRLTCLGQPVTPQEASCLVLCGWAVVVLNLYVNHVPLGLLPPGWLG